MQTIKKSLEKSAKLIELAAKYLFRYRRRYLFLCVALTFGFGIVTLITSLKAGMEDNLYSAAQAHYAGDIVIMGRDKSSEIAFHIDTGTMAAVFDTVERIDLRPAKVYLRTNVQDDAVLFYNGEAIEMKYVIGVDWDTEADYLNSLTYTAPPEGLAVGDDSLLLPKPIADRLNAKLGDSVVLEVITKRGLKNTHTFVIRGIVDDSSIFGYYKVYVSRPTLNRAVEYEPDACSIIGLFLRDKRQHSVENTVSLLQTELQQVIPMSGVPHSRRDMTREREKSWDGIRCILITISVYVEEIAELMDALTILTYALYSMMLLIIFVSAMVTYRLILHERLKEAGTMRAIGFYSGDIQVVLILEAVFLAFFSIVLGLLLSRILVWASSFLPFSWFPSFEIFMKNGRLSALYVPKTVFANIAALFGILIAAVWLPAYQVSRDPLPQLLSGGLR